LCIHGHRFILSSDQPVLRGPSYLGIAGQVGRYVSAAVSFASSSQDSQSLEPQNLQEVSVALYGNSSARNKNCRALSFALLRSCHTACRGLKLKQPSTSDFRLLEEVSILRALRSGRKSLSDRTTHRCFDERHEPWLPGPSIAPACLPGYAVGR
jgi:hypothetical protein